MTKYFIMCFLFCIGCTNVKPVINNEKPIGEFPIIELKYRDRVEYVNLLIDHHYIIDWDLDEESPTFYVFNRTSKSKLKTKSWEEFIREIKKWPNGVEVSSIARCTISFGMGIDEDKAKELRKIVQEKAFKGLKESDPRFFVFCYCETLETNILYDQK